MTRQIRCIGRCAFTVLLLFPSLFLSDSLGFEDSISRKGDLLLVVAGLKNDRGAVRAALVDSKESFAEDGRYIKQAVIPIAGHKAEYLFTNIPFGKYAIKLYHDENSNGRLDTVLLFGIPAEPYGFSNNAVAAYGRPQYSEASFMFEKSGERVSISLQ